VQLTEERWKCPEALFNPSLVGLESMGVAGWCRGSNCSRGNAAKFQKRGCLRHSAY